MRVSLLWKSICGAAALLLGAAGANNAAAAEWKNLVQNGSFEDGLAHWTLSPIDLVPERMYTGPYRYDQGVPFYQGPGSDPFYVKTPIDNANGPLGNPGFDAVGEAAANVVSLQGLRQTLTLPAGHYRVGFDLLTYPWGGGFNPGAAYAWLGPRGLFSGIESSPVGFGQPNAPWSHYTTEFDVDNAVVAELVLFGIVNPNVDAVVAVDRVYVALAVPEPGTYALMLAGLGVVAALVRRRAQFAASVVETR